MPVFIAALLGGLAAAMSSLVGRVLIALGISYVAYTGISTALDALKAQIISEVAGMPATVLTVLSLLKFDVAISILFSAYAARMVLKGLSSGAVTRMVIKP
jgi:hypothetical protein